MAFVSPGLLGYFDRSPLSLLYPTAPSVLVPCFKCPGWSQIALIDIFGRRLKNSDGFDHFWSVLLVHFDTSEKEKAVLRWLTGRRTVPMNALLISAWSSFLPVWFGGATHRSFLRGGTGSQVSARLLLYPHAAALLGPRRPTRPCKPS